MGASCTCYATVSPVVVETRTIVKEDSPDLGDTGTKMQSRKTSRFKRRSELSVTSDDNPQQVYLIHLSAVLLNPSDCPQLVDFILDKPVIMVEVGVVVDKGGKSGGPKKIIVEPEIDWDGLDITQQVPRRLSLSNGTTRVYGVLSRSFNCQLGNEKVTLNALLLGQKQISLTTDIQDDKEYSLRDVTDMFKCFMAENTGNSKKISTIRKVSFAERIRNNSGEDYDGKEADTDSRSSRLISAYLADDSVRQHVQTGKEILRKVSVGETVITLPDKESVTIISKSIKEEKIRSSPPETESQSHQKRQRRYSLEEKLVSKEKKKIANENVHRRHSVGDQRRKNVRKVTPHCKVLVTEPGAWCAKDPELSELEEEENERRLSTVTDTSDNVYASTCSLQRKISSSVDYFPLSGSYFDPITELSCEEDDGDRKKRDKQRSVSFT
ncbi:uncharacterized protein LOC125673696 [Ostrea edulis]|uniref:uncharacterized protein LOC125673696 n=1 Tax=Ostrea edulis TaxID=37623 RepID=UPI0024AF0A04|nr:uncharacterized protein LOC125673696 [Ostrea edulis]